MRQHETNKYHETFHMRRFSGGIILITFIIFIFNELMLILLQVLGKKTAEISYIDLDFSFFIVREVDQRN